MIFDIHIIFSSQFIWEVFFHTRISSHPLFHLKNPAMQDFYRIFNRDCELVSQLPILYYIKNFSAIKYICINRNLQIYLYPEVFYY